MIKQGFMIVGEEQYTLYEVEGKGFYRFDICKMGTPFHTDPLNIIFSTYRRKNTYMFGDRELYNLVKEIKDKLTFAKLEPQSESSWVDGKFIMRRVRGTDNNFFMDKKFSNGKFESETYVDGERVVQLSLMSDIEFNTLPINSNQYETVIIDGSFTQASSPYVPLSVLQAKHNLQWVAEREYFVVETEEQAEEVLEECVNSKFTVGFDYETDGLEFNLYTRNNIAGIVLSPKRGVSYYIPIGMKKMENIRWEFLEKVEEAFQKIHMQSDYTEDDDISVEGETSRGAVAHNAKFEHKVSKAWNLNIPIRHDSFILSYILNPNKFKGTHSLKGLEYERSGLKFLEFEDIFLDKNFINFMDLDKELTRVYACPDADNTCGVLEDLWMKLPPYQRALYELEAQLVEVKADQEYWGIRIDEKVFIENYRTAMETQDLLIKLIQVMLRSEAKINSTQVLQTIIYDKMKAPVVLRTAKGKPSTSSKALRKLATIPREVPVDIIKEDIVDSKGRLILKKSDLNKAKFPVILILEKYREVNKQITAFYNRIIRDSKGDLKRIVDEELGIEQVEGFQTRYFFWVAQYGAESGRQSSPIHQLPKVIKRGVRADSDDHYLADTDYMQVELRLLFSMAGETKLVELCEDPDNDMHRAIACLLQDKQMWEISADERQKDKARNFGVVYLISGMGLALQKYGAGATKEQIAECNQSIDEFYRGARRVSQFIKKNREIVLRDKQISTLFNRTRYFPELADPDLPRDRRESLIRQANNLPVQGIAADIMKRAEVNLDIIIKQKGWDKLVDTPQGKFPLVRSMLSAHDELLASCHNSIPVEEIMLAKRQAMEISIEGFAPLFVGTSIIDNWEEGKASKFEVPVTLRNKMIDDYLATGKSALDMSKSPKEEMLRITNEFRENNLREYMEGLIAEHGDVLDNLYIHIKHDSLTHELIDRFPQTKEDEDKDGTLAHIDQIRYSCEKYLEYRKIDAASISVEEEELIEARDDEDVNTFFEEISGLADSLVTFDPEGNMIYEEGYTEEEDEMSLMFDDELEFIAHRTSGEELLVWQTFNNITINVEELFPNNIDKVLSKVWETKDTNGFYEVLILYNNELVKTGIKVENMDIEEVNKYVIELKELQANTVFGDPTLGNQLSN